ncbi:hypothetical protein GM418_10885 [Maribellus comscasis]|uniref:Uncharacterized protein n=1 Tax=Maribellus comscasis TaxID=2681766 RepID=A0A6I6JMM1_9BACT|nr:hypothetical protein [Maribellus comscasis]QGY44145.1 hypothetical protein GM418_10885 [Maribellus comscasis]
MKNETKKKEKIRYITPEQFHDETLKHIRLSLRNLLFRYQISYRIETDPEQKKKKLEVWEQTKKELGQIEAVLDIACREKIESVTVKTSSGTVYDCSQVKPLELGDNELSNLLVNLSKTMK